MNKKISCVIIGFLFAIANAGCTVKPAIPMSHQPPCRLNAGSSIPLVATAEPDGNITLEWSATAGDVSPKRGSAVTYTAPENYAGEVLIKLKTIRGNKSAEEILSCMVQALPTATPTIAPSPTSTSTPTATYTPLPECLIEDFEGERNGMWWSPDPDVFKYQETHEQVFNGNQSLEVIYNKTSEYQFVGVELPMNLCNFQDAKKLHVWVYGEVTLLLKLEDHNSTEVDVSEQSSMTPDNWTLLTFNYVGVADKIDLQNIKGFFLFPEPEDESATGTFYLDDISLYP